MKKIRRGNDFVFAWEIVRNGLPEDLSSVLEKHLYLSVLGKRVELLEGVDYDITGNVVRIEVTPTIANILGTYKAEFHYILPDNGFIDEDRKCAVDVEAFVIVNSTAQADDPSEFTVTSDMAIAFKGDKGDNGDSAYQVWLNNGHEGTVDDFEAWMRQPATDAAQTANEAADNANNAASNANTAADNANDTANHPTYIAPDNYVYIWNKENQEYEKTDIYVKGDNGDTIINQANGLPLKMWVSDEDLPDPTENDIIYIQYE